MNGSQEEKEEKDDQEVEKDLIKLGITKWKEQATDRKKWKLIVEKAKTHPQL